MIPFTREAELVPVKNFIDVSLFLGAETLASPKSFDIKVESKVEDGIVVLRLATAKRKGYEAAGSQEGILLDIDFGFEGPSLTFADYKRCVERARKHNRALFESLVTEEYRQYLRGETL